MHEDLAHAPRLDSATAIANLGGDESLYAEAVDIFLTDAANQLASLDQALAREDFPTSRRAAHSLKGTAATIGAERLRHCAYTLECACAEADADKIGSALPVLRAELTATMALLRDYLATLRRASTGDR